MVNDMAERELSQMQMARALDMSQGLVSRYVKRGMPLTVLEAHAWLRNYVGPRIKPERRQPSRDDLIHTANVLAKLMLDDFDLFHVAFDVIWDEFLTEDDTLAIHVPDEVM